MAERLNHTIINFEEKKNENSIYSIVMIVVTLFCVNKHFHCAYLFWKLLYVDSQGRAYMFENIYVITFSAIFTNGKLLNIYIGVNIKSLKNTLKILHMPEFHKLSVQL